MYHNLSIQTRVDNMVADLNIEDDKFLVSMAQLLV